MGVTIRGLRHHMTHYIRCVHKADIDSALSGISFIAEEAADQVDPI